MYPLPKNPNSLKPQTETAWFIFWRFADRASQYIYLSN